MPLAKSIYVAGFAGGIVAIISIVVIQMRDADPKRSESTAPHAGAGSVRTSNIQTDDNPRVVSPTAGRSPADWPVAGPAPKASSPAPVHNTQQEPGAPTTGRFDYARYKATDLDEVIEPAPPQAGVNVYWGLRLKIAVRLVSYGEPCNADFLKRAMIMGGATKESVDNAPITHCIKVRSAKGKILPLYIQDRVAEFLPKEVPLGGVVILYAVQVYISLDAPSLLVNEFSASASPAGGQGSLSGRPAEGEPCGCGLTNLHPGTDYAAPAGTPVPAADAGVIVKIEDNELALVDVSDAGHCGRYVVIKHDYPNGRSVFTRYSQLGRLIGSDGRALAVGTRIMNKGKIGEVGSSNLFHFDVRPVERASMDSSAAWLQRYGTDPTMQWSRYRTVDPATFDFTDFGRTGTDNKKKTTAKKTP